MFVEEIDKEWLRELSEATGWDDKDIVEDLRSSDKDPSERAKRYHELFRGPEISFKDLQKFLNDLFNDTPAYYVLLIKINRE